MKKTGIISIIAVILVIAMVATIVVTLNKKSSNTQGAVKLATVEDMQNLAQNINSNLVNTIPNMMVNIIDVNSENVKSFTGLSSTDGIETLVVSEPMISSQAYSMVLLKTTENAKVEDMKKEMLDNINMAKWICVSAEEIYVTNYGDVICLVMSNSEWTKPAYEEFKKEVGGKVGKELSKKVEI